MVSGAFRYYTSVVNIVQYLSEIRSALRIDVDFQRELTPNAREVFC